MIVGVGIDVCEVARFEQALAKALGASPGMSWQDAEVVRLPSGEPSFAVTGTVRAALEARGGGSIHLSLSHDGGIASAMVVVES